MNTYIALLRGINVSGQKKIKMATLKAMFESMGFTSVLTYIQSGNVIFMSKEKDTKQIEVGIYNVIKNYFGFEVPVLVITNQLLKSIHENNPYLHRIQKGEILDNKMYFTLLKGELNTEAVSRLNQTSYVPEEFVITKDAVYFHAANGYGKTKFNNNFFEKKLQCAATTRNLKTVRKLLELSNSED